MARKRSSLQPAPASVALAPTTMRMSTTSAFLALQLVQINNVTE